ncbi:hypothetical protein JCM9279_003142 [Rhodotorula babjevae]
MQHTIPGLPAAPAIVPPLVSSSPSSSCPTSPRTPRRKIFTDADLAPWFRSEAYDHLHRTILRLTTAVVGRPNDHECFESEATSILVQFLRHERERIAQVPLQTSPQRFGNKAFRDWLEGLEQAEPELQHSLLALAPDLSDSLKAAVTPELHFHLVSSFGSPQRLDYGTGHELSFVAYLVCLVRARVFSERDECALVLRVFAEYIETVHEVQRVFRLEPAGSKGVWGLDDHQHLVYLFGAAQLVGHLTLRPSSILSPSTLSAHAPTSLFLSSIQHIHTLKRGPFAEHSPLLHQIATTVPSFAKVAKGLWDMYRHEVLAKVPVVQHCRFGDVALRWVDRDGGEGELPSSGDGREQDAGEEAVEGEGAGLAQAITPAPWVASSGAPGANGGGVRPLPPPSRLGASTTISTSTSSASSAFSRRQHPSTFPLPPHTSSAPRTSFQPPTLFPSRAPHASPSPRTSSSTTTTVADQGGAAAASSPFGILPRVGLGGDAALERGGGPGRAGGEGGGPSGTRAPWTQ